MPGRCTDSLLQYGDRQVREQAPQPQFLAAWRRLEGCPWSSGRWRQISDDERGVVYVGTKQEEEWLADEYEYGSRKRVVVMFERGKAVGVKHPERGGNHKHTGSPFPGNLSPHRAWAPTH